MFFCSSIVVWRRTAVRRVGSRGRLVGLLLGLGAPAASGPGGAGGRCDQSGCVSLLFLCVGVRSVAPRSAFGMLHARGLFSRDSRRRGPRRPTPWSSVCDLSDRGTRGYCRLHCAWCDWSSSSDSLFVQSSGCTVLLISFDWVDGLPHLARSLVRLVVL